MTYLTKSRSPNGTRASRELTEMQRSARQHVVHIQLVHALFGLLLEGLGRGRKVRVFIAEQLVGNFARHEHAHVGLLVDGLAAQVHAHARADGGDVIGAEHAR